MKIYLIVILVMSLFTFIIYGVDKSKAKNNKWRIKESVLLLSSFLGGSIGGLLGLYVLRHKTKHWYFVVVNIVSFIIHVALGTIIYKMIG